MRPMLTGFGIVIFSLVHAGSTVAIMGKMSLEQLASAADSIVAGKVDSVRYHKEAVDPLPGHPPEVEFVTRGVARVIAEQVLKGRPAEVFLVEFFRDSEDSLSYRAGERVIVFLKSSEGGELHTTVGLLQGKLLVQDGKVGDTGLPAHEFLAQLKDLVSRTESGQP